MKNEPKSEPKSGSKGETNVTSPESYKHSVYTDLALETTEALCERNGESKEDDYQIDGVTIEKEERNGAEITWVRILNENGAEQLGKPIGNYVTVESSAMKEGDVDAHEKIIKILSEILSKLKPHGDDTAILVVGLGNSNVTPDALGPKVISKTLVTRHIMNSVPDETAGKVRPVAAVTPGVMGTTGIETCDIIKGICDQTSPSLVIAIDALAARKTSRINATIQLSDTGLSPGAGMGNHRKALNEAFLGIPVIAIGVPTVVDAATLVNDTMDIMLSSMIEELTESTESGNVNGAEFYRMLQNLEQTEKYSLIKQVLDPDSGNMFVTPKEVDAVIDRLSNIIANAINISLHPGITTEDINRFMY